MSEPRIVLNGINALTGEYLVPPMTLAEAADRARGTPPPAEQARLRHRHAPMMAFGPPVDINPTDPAEAGWAVVFTPETPAEVRQALKPLLDLRSRQVPSEAFKALEYKPGETRDSWLGRYKYPGTGVEAIRVPHYLLLVGSPAAIPFEFQFLLDMDYAVGRLAFDRVEDYRRYAEAVVAYETEASVANGKEVVYWGTRHEADRATQLSADFLVQPLFAGVPPTQGPEVPAIAGRFKFHSRCLRGEEATKERLLEVLHSGNQAPPSILFTASHGMGGWPKGDAGQRPGQGALLCQEWTGLGRIEPEHYLTAAEIAPDARLQGLVTFVFACYGAGTPRYDPFLKNPSAGPVEVADAPLVSALAQRLLAGGALAVIGHVERAWGYSIQPYGVGTQLQPFRNLIGRLMAGEPVGFAMRDFSERYMNFSTNLLSKLDPSLPAARKPTDEELVRDWIECNDARNYLLLGDPAVRLRVNDLKILTPSTRRNMNRFSPNPRSSMPAQPFVFNGLNGATGEYVTPPLPAHDVAKAALGEAIDPQHLRDLKDKARRANEPSFAAVEGVDITRLEEAGWGVVFAANADAGLRDALKELLDHRRAQAAKVNEKLYQEFTAHRAYRPGESKQEYLARLGVGPGPVDPEKGVPYYLLLVGDPQAIPFRVQYQLDVQYAVGRLWFDTLDEYRRYAHSVVAAETGKIQLPRRAAFFGVSNPDDPATGLSARQLVEPLAQALGAKPPSGQPAWEIRTAIGAGQTTKAQLAPLLGGGDTPALLFTASHGMAFPTGDPRQLPHQGALLCQDWPGPRAWRQEIPPK
jgi:hypothetical protein